MTPPHPHTNSQPSTHTCTPFNLHLFTFMCSLFCSYKVPAKGDGVDYVRTEDEVCTWMSEGSLNLYMSLQRNTCQQQKYFSCSSEAKTEPPGRSLMSLTQAACTDDSLVENLFYFISSGAMTSVQTTSNPSLMSFTLSPLTLWFFYTPQHSFTEKTCHL